MPNVTAVGEVLFDVYPDKKKLGGAPFNFIYHIMNLTGSGNFISRVGNDDPGSQIISFFKKNNISAKYLQVDDRHPTGEAKPTLSNTKIPEWEIKLNCAYDFINLTDEIESLVEENTTCLYFGTLAQREEKSRETIQSLFNKNIKYFCDLNIRQEFYSKEIIQLSMETADVLKLNEDELKLVNKLVLKDAYEIGKTAEKLIQDFNIELLCVTKGEEGSILFRGGEMNEHKTKINKDKIVDTVGAGDAFASILCAGYLDSWSLKKINETASVFASEIIMINGALPDNKSFYENFKNILADG